MPILSTTALSIDAFSIGYHPQSNTDLCFRKKASEFKLAATISIADKPCPAFPAPYPVSTTGYALPDIATVFHAEIR